MGQQGVRRAARRSRGAHGPGALLQAVQQRAFRQRFGPSRSSGDSRRTRRRRVFADASDGHRQDRPVPVHNPAERRVLGHRAEDARHPGRAQGDEQGLGEEDDARSRGFVRGRPRPGGVDRRRPGDGGASHLTEARAHAARGGAFDRTGVPRRGGGVGGGAELTIAFPGRREREVVAGGYVGGGAEEKAKTGAQVSPSQLRRPVRREGARGVR